jgi:hypothetical protein
MPKSGGPYNYLKENLRTQPSWTVDVVSFIWQLTFSLPYRSRREASDSRATRLRISRTRASVFFAKDTVLSIPVLGDLAFSISASNATILAIVVVAFCVFLLYRKITIIEKFGSSFGLRDADIAWIIFAGLTNFDPKVAFDFPPDAFYPSTGIFSWTRMAASDRGL